MECELFLSNSCAHARVGFPHVWHSDGTTCFFTRQAEAAGTHCRLHTSAESAKACACRALRSPPRRHTRVAARALRRVHAVGVPHRGAISHDVAARAGGPHSITRSALTRAAAADSRARRQIQQQQPCLRCAAPMAHPAAHIPPPARRTYRRARAAPPCHRLG